MSNIIFIGEIIDKLSIVNIKIWDATKKAHAEYKKGNNKKASILFKQIELMNSQRKGLISEINMFFHKGDDMLNTQIHSHKRQKK